MSPWLLTMKTCQDMDNVVSQLRSASTWKPAADLGTRLTKIIHETLRDHTMESYTYRVDSHKKPIQRSFEKVAMLLTNMLVTHANIDEPAQPVPKLSELLLLLNHFFNPQDPHTAKELEAEMDSKAKARFAYLTIFDIKSDEKFRVPTDDDVSEAIDFMSSNAE
ncbi:uncharacterized protein MELLADRAFT_113208 [Melampsora larici-populina 98AG31]|uniref:Uncharacterized protein n=1 Tax=Melampsora larici-populina (strain 98AG31 / pathotype 3-4-7) TaxID=747676 RepID=F4S942_MELLP|nr:uncharacterized protein MELLADRAFT_113208 [Melampsora larici-populina 98AG31]EGF98852.1 hypothetical protein MELLADRAFT_113208 [Melampsora larici-populina 98AG31]